MRISIIKKLIITAVVGFLLFPIGLIWFKPHPLLVIIPYLVISLGIPVVLIDGSPLLRLICGTSRIFFSITVTIVLLCFALKKELDPGKSYWDVNLTIVVYGILTTALFSLKSAYLDLIAAFDSVKQDYPKWAVIYWRILIRRLGTSLMAYSVAFIIWAAVELFNYGLGLLSSNKVGDIGLILVSIQRGLIFSLLLQFPWGIIFCRELKAMYKIIISKDYQIASFSRRKWFDTMKIPAFLQSSIRHIWIIVFYFFAFPMILQAGRSDYPHILVISLGAALVGLLVTRYVNVKLLEAKLLRIKPPGRTKRGYG